MATEHPLTLEAAAFHEAGHAVLALALDVPVGEVGIGLDDTGRPHGWCDIRATFGPGLPFFDAVAQLAHQLAGLLAQRMAAGDDLAGDEPAMILAWIDSVAADPDSPWRQDAWTARLWARLHPSQRHDLLLSLAWQVATHHLRERWAVVQDIAEALLQRSVLSADEVRRLFGRKPGSAEGEVPPGDA